MLIEFNKHIKNEFPKLQNEQFLLACSAGIDSTVLAHLCTKSGLKFSIAHCNFHLRAEESDKDEDLVRSMATGLNKEFHITHFNTLDYIKKNKVSLEMAARDLRYAWFEQLVETHGYSTLVTAHHSDDNLETFFINLSRGTGIKGLIGMPEKTDLLSRPLLIFSNEQIKNYAESEKLVWREDESNTDTKHHRNKLRHELVPVLKELRPTFLENFEKTLSNLKGSAALIDNHIGALKKELFEEYDGVIQISIEKIKCLNPLNAYLFELFKDYGFKAWADIRDLLTGMSGKEVRSSTHRLLKDRENLLLQKIIVNDSKIYWVQDTDSVLKHPINLSIELTHGIENTNDPDILYVDKKSLKYPLVVRKWQEGDYFYPFGMKGKKKVSKFFKDEKMDVISKEKQWLLYSDDNLVWIIGKRGDERFKVTKETKNILKLTLN